MAGHIPWSKVREKMSPADRKRVAERVEGMKIGMLIAELREELGLTQQEIADRLGITQPGISQMEAGDEMQLSTLRRLIGAMGGEVVLQMPGRAVSLGQLAGDEVSLY